MSWRKTAPGSIVPGLPTSSGWISVTHCWLPAIEHSPEQCWSRSWGVEGLLHGPQLERKTSGFPDLKQVPKDREEIEGWGCGHRDHVLRRGSKSTE